ncbi:MAG: hypothetical protein Q9160_001445 [Pyrenula sp. 1 TL-2023]
MAAVATAPGLPGAHHKDASELSLSTIPDPRSASTSDLSRTDSASPRHPDLSSEVEKLSSKLISAINHQTMVDDTLAQTTHELEESRARIRQLEDEAKAHREELDSGALVTKEAADNDKSKLTADLAEERRQKSFVQQQKRGIEQELETLTASLFEEANKMVAAANHERDAMEKKNQQLKEQIKDTENLLYSQQEQLTELKLVMHEMTADRSDVESARMSTAPSSPGLHRDDTLSKLMESLNLTPSSPNHHDVTPAPATSFSHLLKPICRTDVPAYEDFQSLIALSLKSQPTSRVTSGSYAGITVPGLGKPSNDSTASLPLNRGSNTANAPSAPSGSAPSPQLGSKEQLTPLKETKFYKRILTEDVEPALRLDLAPGVSWLTRRSIVNAICDGSLIVEPIPEQSVKLYGRFTSCSCCGESRKGEHNPRTHRMRMSESENATRWPLCVLCLEKFRATCDLVGFVRMIKDGVVRFNDGDKAAEIEAWEELVRLRERLFWARLTAGVVPAFLSGEKKSEKDSPVPRSSQDSIGAVLEKGKTDEVDLAKTNDDVFGANAQTSVSVSSSVSQPVNDTSSPEPSPLDSGNETSDEVEGQLKESLQESLQREELKEPADEAVPTTITPPSTPPRSRTSMLRRIFGEDTGAAKPKGSNLKVSIPGGFD